MEAETWLSGEKAAEYFDITVGEENTAVAAVQDYTKLYCKHTPETLTKEPEKADTAADAKNRNLIAAMAIQHMI